MYGLPEDIDLTFLIGEELIQYAVGQNEIILNFHPGASITVESELKVTSPLGSFAATSPRLAAVHVDGLLGSVIVTATGTPDGTTSLTFDDGTVVEIFDNTEHYESYTITSSGTTIVV